jgi:D-alanyl-D-alanine carboxypeptidase
MPIRSRCGCSWTNDEAIDIAAVEGAYFPPGTSWRYSNTNYTLLGMVLDRAGGKSWRAQVRERLLLPLGMFSTHLPEPGDRRIASNYARGYHYIDGTPLDLTGVDPSMSGASGGNAMVTTVADLGWFLDALLGGRLFREAATLTAMTTMIDAPHESGLPHQYGLGLESFVMPDGTKVIGHSGGAAGYAVMMFRLADQRTTLVTAINTSDLMTNAVEVFIPALNVITASVEQK